MISNVFLGDCPCGWEDIDDVCYYFSYTKLTWEEARADCQQRGGDLATPLDVERNNAIYQEIKRRGIQGAVWLGMFKIWNHAFFNICGLELSFTKWNTHEPNNKGVTENCVEMLNRENTEMSMNSYWNDQTCTDMLHYVCELHYPRCE